MNVNCDQQLALWAEQLAAVMPGRSLLRDELVSLLSSIGGEEAAAAWEQVAELAYVTGAIRMEPSIAHTKRTSWWGLRRTDELTCCRCGAGGDSIAWTSCASCGQRCAYCEVCLTMGRTKLCAPLYVGAAASSMQEVAAKSGLPAAADLERVGTGWFAEICARLPDLQLSPAQAAAAEAGVAFVREGWRLAELGGDRVLPIRPFLIWAVTGAGKTEMMYPLVAAARMRGGKVLIATPRKDVVLELLPRIERAFSGERIAALYGGSRQRWDEADIVIATTHQLLRYSAGFDLVVLDEVDAFPYHGDPMLEYAARKACKPGGAFVMLSATPPEAMQRAVARGQLPHVKVPVRYHRHPLPVPRYAPPARLAELVRQSLARGAQVFVFVPQIARLGPELRHLRDKLSACLEASRIDATSSQDPDRADKVLRLRSGDIRVLLTTTILERGVTIAKADVYVLGADSRLFDAAALVQMAGRAGRSAADPHGQVRFLTTQRTRATASALRQIRAMNRLARRRGYLVADEGRSRWGVFWRNRGGAGT